jgi:hypothetical protein
MQVNLIIPSNHLQLLSTAEATATPSSSSTARSPSRLFL